MVLWCKDGHGKMKPHTSFLKSTLFSKFTDTVPSYIQVLFEHSHCDEDHQGVSKPETLDDQPGLLTSPDSWHSHHSTAQLAETWGEASRLPKQYTRRKQKGNLTTLTRCGKAYSPSPTGRVLLQHLGTQTWHMRLPLSCLAIVTSRRAKQLLCPLWVPSWAVSNITSTLITTSIPPRTHTNL